MGLGRNMITNFEADAGPKGVTAFTMLRLGLAWGSGAGAHQMPQFGHNWGLLLIRDLEMLLSELVRKMKSQPYRTGDMLMMLLREEKEWEVVTKEGVSVRGLGGWKRAHTKGAESSNNRGRHGKSRKR